MRTRYGRHMAAAILRLLTLFALVLMPFGMSSGVAIAKPVMDHAAMPMGHCDDQQGKDKAPAPKPMHCMACTVAPART